MTNDQTTKVICGLTAGKLISWDKRVQKTFDNPRPLHFEGRQEVMIGETEKRKKEGKNGLGNNAKKTEGDKVELICL